MFEDSLEGKMYCGSVFPAYPIFVYLHTNNRPSVPEAERGQNRVVVIQRTARAVEILFFIRALPQSAVHIPA